MMNLRREERCLTRCVYRKKKLLSIRTTHDALTIHPKKTVIGFDDGLRRPCRAFVIQCLCKIYSETGIDAAFTASTTSVHLGSQFEIQVSTEGGVLITHLLRNPFTSCCTSTATCDRSNNSCRCCDFAQHARGADVMTLKSRHVGGF